ncbi:MAG: polyketide-type polyunsaturated fatty acid synthase PfaA [Deltaproteobacteria bacterium]|nr:MAG: polyketide-type polyunsaturated fatty acid synthase PfaA [Deltaproteobacteria bacterium]
MQTRTTDQLPNTPVAIIGIGCFFPKAPGLKSYWRLLYHGMDAITDVPDSHWSIKDYFDADPAAEDKIYCTRGGFLSPVDFDPTEYGIPPNTLEATDTSQLLGLVAAKTALEDAGYGENGQPFNRERTSVILGVTGTQELVIPLGARLDHPKWRRALKASGIEDDKVDEVVQRISASYVSWQENSFPGLLGNVVAGRISNRLDLGGTNCVVDAACASSMSAIHLSVLELTTGRADMVLTGGVDTLNDIFMHMCFAKTRILSPTGDIRPFSAEADGTVLGEGVGIVVLKRLEDARRDKNRIYAVIRGVGTSSDGRSQSIYAPRKDGQVKAMRMAYDLAGVDPASVDLVEAHGTGTRVGDQTEFDTLSEVFPRAGDGKNHRQNRCALGAVKSMIGHTKAAAGTAGLIKTALALHHKTLPPTLKADNPDPDLHIEESPFYLNTTTRPWLSRPGHPRRGGVSAFGFGGSNFHLVLEEFQSEKQETAWDGSVEIVTLSADTADALSGIIADWIKKIEPGPDSGQLAIDAADSRTDFESSARYRLLFMVDRSEPDPSRLKANLSDIRTTLAETDSDPFFQTAGDVFLGIGNPPGKLAFVFPGQGSQYVGMGRDLSCIFPEALDAFESFNRVFENGRLSDFIFPCPVNDKKSRKAQEDHLRPTDVAQPAIGAMSLALYRILSGFGIVPSATCGHSYGELVALLAGGWMDTETFCRVSIARGRLMAEAGATTDGDPGTMMAVKAALADLDTMVAALDSDVILANRNSPRQGVLSGSTAAIKAAQKKCRELKFRAIPLPVAAAFHSPLVASAQKPFRRLLSDIDLTPTEVPVFSNTTGTAYPEDADTARDILGRQIINPVDFVSNIENLYDTGIRTFVEVGPKTVLTGLIRQILRKQDFTALAVDASSGKKFGLIDLARCLCHLAALGYPVDLDRWESPPPSGKQRTPLMRFPISGANYKNPRSDLSQGAAATTAPAETRSDAMSAPAGTPLPQDPTEQEMSDKPITPTPAVNVNASRPDRNPADNSLTDTAMIIREGLKSMRELQARTASAHELFLKTQADASQVLQSLMSQTRDMAHTSGIIEATSNTRNRVDHAVHHPAADPKQTPAPPPTVDPLPLSVPVDPPVEPAAPSQALAPTLPETDAAAGESSNTNAVAKTLFNVISELTGYPADMLNLDMDIESDLGIDSIKRVEILSAMEEKMPELPSVAPEDMGDLKTLGQIVGHLCVDPPATPEPISPLAQPSDTAATSPEADSGTVTSTLMDVISELTGYPADMLNLDMDIESDLGIDSIKRVEILSAMEEKMPELPSVAPEDMGDLKTLGQIVRYLTAGETAKDAPFPAPETDARPPEKDTGDSTVRRRVIEVKTRRFSGQCRTNSGNQDPIYITEDGTGLSTALADAFSGQGMPARVIATDAAALEQVDGPIGGLIPVLPANTPIDVEMIRNVFLLARSAGKRMQKTGSKSPRLFCTVTRMDGAFGFLGTGVPHPIQGALAGLVKTAAAEWPDIRCQAIDAAPGWDDHCAIAGAILTALTETEPRPPLEIGLHPDLAKNEHYILSLQTADISNARSDLSAGDVVVVSGGARGITATAVEALARDTGARFALLGRSPQPVEPPEWLPDTTDAAGAKKAILANEFAPGSETPPPSPIELEQAFRRHMANSEIYHHLKALADLGITARYYPVDVTDAKGVSRVIGQIRTDLGPITALIHGAGLLRDSFILDKTVQEFNQVFATKAGGLLNLLAATRNDELKNIVLFSSVSARFGNPGQSDYAMANEAVNKIAQAEAIQRPHCNVSSINWGPWEGGMVSPALKRLFARRGISLIPAQTGADCLVREMGAGPESPVEVTIGNEISAPMANVRMDTSSQIETTAARNLSLSFRREIDVHRYPVLKSHMLDGHPVIPFALMTEWFAHGALHENPGLLLQGIDDMRILKGIRLDNGAKTIRLMAGKASRLDNHFEIPVELHDGVKEGIEVVHCRGRAILAENLHPAPDFTIPAELTVRPYPRSIEDVYETILFHGEHLRGLKKIQGLTENGMVADICSAPRPDQWMTEPLRSTWLADPLALDTAFQMASVWCYEQQGMVSLPSYTASYRQYTRQFPKSGLVAVLEIRDVTSRKMTGDFTFVGPDQAVVARLLGYEATMDPALYQAFKPGAAGDWYRLKSGSSAA